DYLYIDKFLIKSGVSDKGAPAAPQPTLPQKPIPAALDPSYEDKSITPEQVGINLGDVNGKPLSVGKWYETKFNRHVYFSAIEPKMVSKEILETHTDRVTKFDGTEDNAVTYLVAFDLTRYRLGFTVGTDHPSLEWSDRTRD